VALGGAGVASSITGSSVTYCKGGDGASGGTASPGPGYGGGEGVTGYAGKVILRYIGPQRFTGGTVSTITVGGVSYTLHVFTSSGTLAPV
jgi:hypothetical protein